MLLPVAVLLAGILITVTVSQLVRQQEEEKLRTEFDLLVEKTAKTIQDRIKANEQVLRGVVGLFSAARETGKPVTRAEFRSFVAALQLDERFPGIQGVGFSRLIQPEQLADHLRTIRAEGFPGYALRPSGQRTHYSSIIYLEPFDWRNQRAFGYDMYAEPVRQRAMERAWKSGSAALSGRVTLVQETDKEVQPGALLYVPVFREGTTPTTDSLRLDNLIGWVYSPLRLKDMISALIERNLMNIDGRLAFSLHDGEEARAENLLFSMAGANAGTQNGLRTSRALEVAGQQWLLTVSAQPVFGWEERGAPAQAVFAIGLLISLLLAAISMILLRSAARDSITLERLAESEQRFQAMFNGSPDGVLTAEIETQRFIAANPSMARLLGYEIDELLEMKAPESHPQDQLQTITDLFGTMARGEAATASGVPMLCKDGRILYADLAVSLHECDGHPCMTGFFRDVTAQKRMTAELDAHRSQLERLIAERTDQLARQKFFLEDLIATLPCGVFRLRHKAPATAAEWADVEHPPHVQDLSSDTYCRLLGISREEAEASQGGVIARIHPDDLNEFLRRVELSNTRLTPFVWEGRMRIGGETRWMRFDAIPRKIDDEIVVSGIVQNIDEQREQSSLIYRSVVEATPDAFVAIDEADRIIEWSAQAEKMFGYPAAEAIGMLLSDAIIPASHAAEHQYHLKHFVASGRDGAIGKRRRVTARRRNESEFPVELQIMALQLEGHWRFTSFIRDISDVVAAEQRLAQAQKLEAIGQLTGGLAHDFNNLLGIVVGNLELMQEGVSPDEADELINSALSAASRGAGVTRSLLAVARRSSPMPMDTDINVLLGELEPLLRQTAGRRINVLMTPHAEHAHSVIDSSAFSNALLNLVINARDAMPNGGGNLLIYSYSMYVELPRADDIDRVDLPEGLYVVVGVDDQGCGMDPETVKKAFEPFFTTKRNGKGTGLGLSMVHAFATQSGGTVRIESTPGKGCSVQIILPARHGKDENNDPPSAGAEGGSANGRLLLVDDEADLLKITGRWLTKLGYQVDTAENAEAALAILASRNFDLLLTDIVMPGEMDGLALARIAASRYPAMKIVLASGYPEDITDDDRRRWALVEKPVRRAVLADAVALALGCRK